jgi:hypothetical protein
VKTFHSATLALIEPPRPSATVAQATDSLLQYGANELRLKPKALKLSMQMRGGTWDHSPEVAACGTSLPALRVRGSVRLQVSSICSGPFHCQLVGRGVVNHQVDAGS